MKYEIILALTDNKGITGSSYINKIAKDNYSKPIPSFEVMDGIAKVFDDLFSYMVLGLI